MRFSRKAAEKNHRNDIGLVGDQRFLDCCLDLLGHVFFGFELFGECLLDEIVVGIELVEVDVRDPPKEHEPACVEFLEGVVAGGSAQANLTSDFTSAPFGLAAPKKSQDADLGVL